MANDDSMPPGGDDPWSGFTQAMAAAAQNATSEQQQIAVVANSATTMGVATLYAIDTSSIAIAGRKPVQK